MNEAIIIPLVLALTDLTKRFGIVSDYAPIVALIIGVGIAYLFAGTFNVSVFLQGIIYGLSASGLWSGGKTVAKLGGFIRR